MGIESGIKNFFGENTFFVAFWDLSSKKISLAISLRFLYLIFRPNDFLAPLVFGLLWIIRLLY